MSSIVPTIGRKVWYWSTAEQCNSGDQAFDATIIYAWPDGEVNLDCCNHVGDKFVVICAPLRDPMDGDTHNSANGTATWMPYQTQQAAASKPSITQAPVVVAVDPATSSGDQSSQPVVAAS